MRELNTYIETVANNFIAQFFKFGIREYFQASFDDAAYQPAWYSGICKSFDMGSTTSSFSSGLGSAISSSVTLPGSSSGGGGGW